MFLTIIHRSGLNWVIVPYMVLELCSLIKWKYTLFVVSMILPWTKLFWKWFSMLLTAMHWIRLNYVIWHSFFWCQGYNLLLIEKLWFSCSNFPSLRCFDFFYTIFLTTWHMCNTQVRINSAKKSCPLIEILFSCFNLSVTWPAESYCCWFKHSF